MNYKGPFAENRTWVTRLIFSLFHRIVPFMLFRLPFSHTGVRILEWLVRNDLEEEFK